MSIEPSAYPAGGRVSLLIFRLEGAELPGCTKIFEAAGGSDGVEPREEAGLD